jgi:hypothetical protein
MKRFLLFISVALISTGEICLAQEQGFPTFDQVDLVVAQDVTRFSKLLAEGRKRVVRLALLGDSQETAPGGGGRVYMPRLNYELSQFFGNAPETLIEPVASTQYAWLMASALLKGEEVDLGNKGLPGIRCMSVPSSGYTYLMMLQPEGAGLLPGTLVDGEKALFRTDGEVKAVVFALAENSAGLKYEAQPKDEMAPGYFSATTSSGELDLKPSGKAPSILTAETGALDFGGKKYLQLRLSCSEEGKQTSILGVRFFNESHAYGVVVNDFSAGGYRLNNLLLSHSDGGEMYRGFGFDAAILHLGANDSGGVSAVDFKKQTEEVIAMLRQWMGDPEYRIILMGDPDFKGHAPGTPKRIEFDQYPGAQAAIAEHDPNVLVVNTRRIADEQLDWRWGDKKLDGYLADTVHYSSEGGRLLAGAEMKVLLGILGK